MTADFLVGIRGEYNQFTKAEKKVADFILNNPKKVLFMSITELAEACGVGDTSVFRFCKTMDCKGYQEFKMLLSLSLNEGKQGLGQIEGDISREDSFAQVAQKVLASNIDALRETHSLLKRENFEKVIECFRRAKRICFYGVGTSMTTAMKAADKFLKIEPKVYCVPDSHMQAMAAALSTPDDVILFFSYSGATKDMLDVLRPARRRGAKIILVTHFAKSPAAAMADVTLLCGSKEGPLQSGSVAVKMGLLFIIDVLFNEYCRTNPALTEANREATAGAISAKLL